MKSIFGHTFLLLIMAFFLSACGSSEFEAIRVSSSSSTAPNGDVKKLFVEAMAPVMESGECSEMRHKGIDGFCTSVLIVSEDGDSTDLEVLIREAVAEYLKVNPRAFRLSDLKGISIKSAELTHPKKKESE